MVSCLLCFFLIILSTNVLVCTTKSGQLGLNSIQIICELFSTLYGDFEKKYSLKIKKFTKIIDFAILIVLFFFAPCLFSMPNDYLTFILKFLSHSRVKKRLTFDKILIR